MTSTFGDMAVMFKLVSGDTIICTVVTDTEKNIVIQNPYQLNIHTVKTDEGIKSMTYYSSWFLGSSTKTHILRKDSVMSVGIPNEDLKQDYANMSNGVKSSNSNNATDTAQNNNWDSDLNFKPNNSDDMSRN